MTSWFDRLAGYLLVNVPIQAALVLALLCGDLRASLRWSGVVICGTLALTALDAWRPPHNIIPPDVAMWVTCAATEPGQGPVCRFAPTPLGTFQTTSASP